MLKVWGRKTSSNVQAVMWCIAELDLSFVRFDIGHTFGGNDTPEFRAMNPNGLVPVLKDGDDAEPIWESSAVLRYIASRYATAPFWPPEWDRRAAVDKWAEWAKVNVAANFTAPIFWRFVRTPAAARDAGAITQAMSKLATQLAIAEAGLSRNAFLAGDDFTLADIVFGHLLYRYFDIDLERPDLPHLDRYYAALTARPAYREHVMISYDDLRVN